MERTHFLAALGTAAAAPLVLPQSAAIAATDATHDPRTALVPGQRLVAFVVTDRATVIDFAGPWEVFQDAPLPGRQDGAGAFVPFLVGETTQAVDATDGLTITPRYTFANAPRPDIIVVGAQAGSTGLIPWLQAQAPHVDLVMSVCTGAFKVAQAGLFDGKTATTHHDFYDAFEKRFPKVKLARGPRFVDQGAVCSAGGLTSGIDLALHVVERYHGAKVAGGVAAYMEFVRTERPGSQQQG